MAGYKSLRDVGGYGNILLTTVVPKKALITNYEDTIN